MKKWFLVLGVLFLFSSVASAQYETPKVEAFGGYQLVHGNYLNTGFTFNGGTGSLSYNPNNWLGIVSDFGGSHWNGSGDTAGLDATLFTYLFGPKIAYRTEKFTPFAQVLFGGAHLSGSLLETCAPAARVHPQGCVLVSSGSEDAFAMTIGGGLDWNATKHFGVRLGQFEYAYTRFNGLGSSGGDSQNSLRFSAGVTARW